MINIYKILMNKNNENYKSIPDKGKSNKKSDNSCPYCQSNSVIKFGFYKGAQRYKCKDESIRRQRQMCIRDSI